MIESTTDFLIFIAALVAAGAAFFPLARIAVNRLTAWIMTRRWNS